MRKMVAAWLAEPAPAQKSQQQRKTSGLDLPKSGRGSVASVGSRVAAFGVDALLAALVAGLFTAPELPRSWSLVSLAAEYVIFAGFFGRTPGMRLAGIRLAIVDGANKTQPNNGVVAGIGPVRALIRTILLVLLIPALLWNSDGRGFHDRLTGVVVVRS